MKTTKAIALIALAFVIANLLSCAGLEIVTHTPYGDAAYKNGTATLTPSAAPITIPVYRDK